MIAAHAPLRALLPEPLGKPDFFSPGLCNTRSMCVTFSAVETAPWLA